MSMLDRIDVGFLPDGTLDQLPAPSQVGGTRIGGIDLNLPPGPGRARRRPSAGSSTTRLLTIPVHRPGARHHRANLRSLQHPPAAYDLRKLRGKQLVIKPGRTRRYHVPGDAALTIAALLTIRDNVTAPLIAAIRTPRRGRPPKHWTHRPRLRNPPPRHPSPI